MIEISGKAGNTITDVASDASQNLDTNSSLAFKNSAGDLLTGLLITIETHDIKFCFGSTPVQGGLGHVLIDGQSLYIRSPANARAFNYINKTAGSNAVLMLTPFYKIY